MLLKYIATIILAVNAMLVGDAYATDLGNNCFYIKSSDFQKKKGLGDGYWGNGVLYNNTDTKTTHTFEAVFVSDRAKKLNVWVEYAAESPRPMYIFLNGEFITRGLSSKTGGWSVGYQNWEKQASISIKQGRNILHFYRYNAIPHVRAVRLCQDSAAPPTTFISVDRSTTRTLEEEAYGKKLDALKIKFDQKDRTIEDENEKNAAEARRFFKERQLANMDLGNAICSWRYENNSGWCGVIEDIRGEKVRVEIQRVAVKGFLVIQLNASECTGNKSLQAGDSGTKIWVPKSCIDEVM